jgi:hypothetical protein
MAKSGPAAVSRGARIEKKVNAALIAAGCAGYTARFIESDDEMDDSVSILLHGEESSWNLQLGPDYCGVNEYGYKDGFIDWMRDHGLYRSQAAAVAKLCALLRPSA